MSTVNNWLDQVDIAPIDDDVEVLDTEMPEKSRRRAVRRKNSVAKTKRKARIAKDVTHYVYPYEHMYSKNKNYCSCRYCAFNHSKSGEKSITHSDMMRIGRLNYIDSE